MENGHHRPVVEARPNAKSPEVRRDEAKVLGFLAAVRVRGDTLLRIADLTQPPKEQRTAARGRWVAASWRGAVQEPRVPLQLVNWKSDGRRIREKTERKPHPDGVIWFVDGYAGEPLPIDRVYRAAASIREIERMHLDVGTELAVLREELNFLQDAKRAGYTGSVASSAFKKADKVLRERIDGVLQSQRDGEARREALRRELAQFSGHPGRREYIALHVHPILEELGRANQRVARWTDDASSATLSRPPPIEDAPGWRRYIQRARGEGPSALERLHGELTQLVRSRPRSNANEALLLHEMIEADDWSSSTAARLWSRARHGLSPQKERQAAQALDQALRIAK